MSNEQGETTDSKLRNEPQQKEYVLIYQAYYFLLSLKQECFLQADMPLKWLISQNSQII
ncbi:unnamed protein product [Paramecium sonneborni]|uniref:Uncharacterized protein n=1 Tax=Paramecium sonneborni TaxID=65129 RepID=A0A8S1KKM5_9CILI|nr:unnamed protein product [Paramecium sonneborni]